MQSKFLKKAVAKKGVAKKGNYQKRQP